MLNNRDNKYYSFFAIVFLIAVCFSVIFLLPNNVNNAFAQSDMYGVNYGIESGLSTTDIRISVVRVIRVLLGLIGIIALVLILYGGFVWMTAAGNPQKIELAKKILVNALIGFVIILMAFSIVQYIFNVLGGGGDGNGGSGYCTPNVCTGCSRCWSDGAGSSCDESCGSSCSCGIPPSFNEFRIDGVQTAHGDILSGHYPDNEQKSNVYWCSKIQTVFNRNLNESTAQAAIQDNTLYVSSSGQNVAGDWAVAGNALVFTPAGDVFPSQNSDHGNHLPQSLEDSQEGLFLSSCSLTAECEGSPPPDFRWEFYVGNEGDLIDPRITTTYPQSSDLANPDTNVSREPIIDVNFSEEVDASTIIDGQGHPYPGHIYLREVGGNQIDNNNLLIRMKANGSGFLMRLVPGFILEEFTYYEITIQDIEDLCGRTMQDPFVWQFATNNLVPGIAGHYPSGDNICPDTVIGVTFNTSMYFDTVEMTIDGGGSLWNYILAPGQTSTSDSNGEFHIVDVGDPASNHYKVFEFDPYGDLQEDSNYHISVRTSKIKNLNQEFLTDSWDFHITDLENCVCSPNITHFNKDDGPVGDCITIYGQCFRGTVAKEATISRISFDGIQAEIGSGYTQTVVATVVPSGFSVDNRPGVSLTIDYASANSVPASNEKEFLITAGTADGPCLWSINPNSGERGQRGIGLTGIRFENYQDTTVRNVVFNLNQSAQIDDEVNSWKNTNITNVIVPLNAETGEVFVMNDNGRSNSLPFSVSYCGNNIIDKNEECDGSNLNGHECVDHGFVGGDLACFPAGDQKQCRFDISNCSQAPSVVESNICQMVCVGGSNDSNSCYDEGNCPGGSCQINTVPSPNPFKNAIDVCLNSVVSARFNTEMNEATLNDSSIYIEECDDSECVSTLGLVGATISYTSSQSFILTPNSELSSSQTYLVTVTSDVESSSGVVMLEDYKWKFTTKDDLADCPLVNAYVEPRKYTMGQYETYDNYHASAVGPHCVIIADDDNYDWEWSIKDSNNPKLGVNVQEHLDDSDASVTTEDLQGLVYVRAETEGKYNQAELRVWYDSCAFDPSVCSDPNQDGVDDCYGSVCNLDIDRCTPVINEINPNYGPVQSCITITGCHFENNKGSGNVQIGGVQATYPCSGSWKNNEVIVQVPNVNVGSNLVELTTNHNLITQGDSFNVTDVCSNGTPVPASGVPCLCSLNPSYGRPDDMVVLSGSNFDNQHDADRVLFSNGREAGINNWRGDSINVSVPDNSVDGNVVVNKFSIGTQGVCIDPGDENMPCYTSQDCFDIYGHYYDCLGANLQYCSSNGLPFNVGDGGVGDPCDANENNGTCEADNNMCWPGLYCETEAGPNICTCQPIPSPNIVSHYPNSNESDVCINALVTAVFDQEMDYGSINNSTFIVEDLDNSMCVLDDSFWGKALSFIKKVFNFSKTLHAQTIIDGTILRNNINNQTQITFVPKQIFKSCNEYRVIIKSGDGGVKSRIGGQMTNDYVWTFSTGEEVCKIDHVDINTVVGSGTDEFTRENVVYDYYSCAGRNNCEDDVDNTSDGNQHRYVAFAKDINNVSLSASYEWQENDPDNLVTAEDPLVSQDVYVTANPIDGKAIVFVTAFDQDSTDDLHYGTSTKAITITNFICQNTWPPLADFPFVDSGNNCNISGYDNCIDMTFSTYFCRDAGHNKNYCVGGDKDGVEGCIVDGDCIGIGGRCASYTEDDLPSFSRGNIRGVASGFCVGGANHGQECSVAGSCGEFGYCKNALKEFKFYLTNNVNDGNPLRQCATSRTPCVRSQDCPGDEECIINTDLVAIKIYGNDNHLSSAAWYEKYMPLQNPYTKKIIDSYDAITTGNTLYVNVAVDRSSSGVFTNMFVISLSERAELIDEGVIETTPSSPEADVIYHDILDNIIFNTNGVDNERLCSSGVCSVSGDVCTQTSQCSEGEYCNIKYCTKDSDCDVNSYCNARKDKLARDVVRIGAIGEMVYHLGVYRGYCSDHQSLPCLNILNCPNSDGNEICVQSHETYPLLESGTYKNGESVSVWKSWNKTFASVLGTSFLLDPLNEIVGAPSGYNEEGWSEDLLSFICPNGSHMYHYDVSDLGDAYSIYANMEYDSSGWVPSNNHYLYGIINPNCSHGGSGAYNFRYNMSQTN